MSATRRRTRKRFEIPGHARFLTFACRHNLPLLEDDPIKDLFVDQLHRAKTRYDFQLHAWVVMPDHVHLLITPRLPEWDVPSILWGLKRSFAQRALNLCRRTGHPVMNQLKDKRGVSFWQRGGGYDRNVYTREELLEKAQYIHANPVRRGLVYKATDWRWSSARWWSGQRNEEVPCDPPW